MGTTAILYARVSTTDQADDGLPIDSQVEQDHAKAAALGARVLQVFKDEGISGRTSRRPAFLEAVEFCARYRVNFFIVWSSSRFARNKIDAANYKKELKRLGTRVVYVSSDVDTTTDEGWFVDGLYELVDEHYSRQIARDTRRSMMKNARDGFFNGGRVPFGYSVVDAGKRKRLEVLPPEARVVQDIFRSYLDGHGTKAIAMGLNREGISRRGAAWDKNVVSLILKNRVYTGHIVFNRTSASRDNRPTAEWVVTKAHDPIISAEDFDAVADKMAAHSVKGYSGSPHSTRTFTGLMRCGVCGAAMQTETAKGRTKRYHYYNCRAALKGEGCGNRRIPCDDFDKWMLDELFERLFTPATLRTLIREVHELTGSWEKDKRERLSALDADLQGVERKMGKIFELFELHGKDTPNLADLTRRLRAHKERRESLEREINALEVQESPAVQINERDIDEAAAFFREVLYDADSKKVRLFLASFIKGITLFSDHVFLEYHPERIVGRKPGEVIAVVHSGRGGWLPDRAPLGTAEVIFLLPDRLRLKAA